MRNKNISKHTHQKPLFKTKRPESPAYASYVQLVALHERHIDRIFLSHWANKNIRAALYAFRNNLNVLTEERYNLLIQSADTIESYIKSILEDQKYKKKLAFEAFFGLWSNHDGLPVNTIGDGLKCAGKTVRVYVSDVSAKLELNILTELFHLGSESAKTDKYAKLRELLTTPLAGAGADKAVDTIINYVPELNWNDNDSDIYYKCGMLFGEVSLKVALGARLLLLGNSHEDVYRARIDSKLDIPDDKPKHDYRHSKRQFLKYVKDNAATLSTKFNNGAD